MDGRQHPELVARVDTFNSAGLGYANPLVVLLESLWADTVGPALRGSSLAAGLVHNYYAEPGPELVASGHFAYRPGEQVPLFIERDDGELLSTHGMGPLVDALAAYRLFAAVDPTLDAAAIGNILEAASNVSPGSIAAAVRALGEALGGAYAGVADPLVLHAMLAPELAAGAWDGARIEPVPAGDTESAVLEQSEAGSARRFAALRLHPLTLVAPAAASERRPG